MSFSHREKPWSRAKGAKMLVSPRTHFPLLFFTMFFPFHPGAVSNNQQGAGTICFQRRWWDAKTFPKSILRDCKSIRPGVLMHSKIMYIRPSDPSIREGRCYAYVGSANLSESAWYVGLCSVSVGWEKSTLPVGAACVVDPGEWARISLSSDSTTA